MSKSARKMTVVDYIDELVDATLRLHAMGDCLMALGSCSGGFDDGTVVEVGEIVCEEADRLETTIARLGDDVCVSLT